MNSPVIVRLSWHEMALAAHLGAQRQIRSLAVGLTGSHGADENKRWDYNIEGAAAEMAFAKSIDRYFMPTCDTFKAGGDGVGNIQVRVRAGDTNQEHWDHLIIRRGDSKDSIFVSLIGRAPDFTVSGWIRGSEAMQEQWLYGYGSRPKAWFVPPTELHSMETLPAAMSSVVIEPEAASSST